VTEAFLFIDPISNLPGFRADWIPRILGADILGDRDFALGNLAPLHDDIIALKYPDIQTRHHAEQIHGKGVTIVSENGTEETVTHLGTDGLITNIAHQLLGIYVADCAAIYLADPVTRSIGLLHSGRKGSELNILANAVGKMSSAFGTDPADLTCVLSPCIRPPHYEVDISQIIATQARKLGIRNFHDSCMNTAEDLALHYSYRMEKGQTGRMLALLSIS
jgi:copper oxidase (laccase) domain-containing protein